MMSKISPSIESGAAPLLSFLAGLEKAEAERNADTAAYAAIHPRPLWVQEGASKRLGMQQEATLATALRGQFVGLMVSSNPEGFGYAPAEALSPMQRLAVIEAATLGCEPGHCMLAINASPGMSRASLWRAVLASRWVQAALDKAPSPPIILGAAATNKAIGGFIDVFSNIAGDHFTLQGRWVDGLPGYGWFLPSTKTALDLPGQMQLDWSADARAPFAAHADAAHFMTLSVDEHRATYLRNARAVFEPMGRKNFEVSDALAILHQRMTELVTRMRNEQVQFGMKIDQFPAVWRKPTKKAGLSRTLALQFTKQSAQLIKFDERAMFIKGAIVQGKFFLSEATRLFTGWRAWVPAFVGQHLWKKERSELDVLHRVAKACFVRVQASWSTDFSQLSTELDRLSLMVAKTGVPLKNRKALQAKTDAVRKQLDELWDARAARRSAWLQFRDLIRQNNLGSQGSLSDDRSILRCVRDLSGDDEERRTRAKDLLWNSFDARQDAAFRVELFHLAARYWEGRWIQAQSGEKPAGAQSALERWMMLGAMVVTSASRLYSFEGQVMADLLVMDEVEQCLPESTLPGLAMRLLALTKSAVFIGETKRPQSCPLNQSCAG